MDNIKQIYTLDEVATVLNVSVDSVKDFINSNDLVAIGSNKDKIKRIDLYKFMGGNSLTDEPIDFWGNQRSNVLNSVSIEVEYVSDKEIEEMIINGLKEPKPYYDRNRNKWCIALSLGYNENGKRIRKIICGKTQVEVWEAYKAYLGTNNNDVQPRVNSVGLDTVNVHKCNYDILFSDVYKKYLKSLESNITNRTYSGYVNLSKIILNKLGNIKVYDINKNIIEDFFNELVNMKYNKSSKMQPKYYSQDYINKVFNLIHGFIRYYSENADDTMNIFASDFMHNMKKPKSKSLMASEIKPLSHKDIYDILNAVKENPMISCWVHLMSECGMRPSEALALTWDDIDFDNKTIYISKALGKESDYDIHTCKRIEKFRPIIKDLKNNTKNNYHSRCMAISDTTLQSIIRWKSIVEKDKKFIDRRKEYCTDRFIFTGPKGNLWLYEDYKQKYERILKKYNIDYKAMNPYRFRHTVCTELLLNRVDLKSVQIIMGDSTSDVILKYYANVERDKVLKSNTILKNRMANIVNNM